MFNKDNPILMISLLFLIFYLDYLSKYQNQTIINYKKFEKDMADEIKNIL
jgi:hypothetical protein